MTEEKDTSGTANTIESPLIFISHDSRDASIAEAFSQLLKSVSAGMLRSFRSSDKTGTEGIDFGDEWYKRLMEKLGSASDVVCLLTERSLDRPWILYEAGVAKGKLGTPVQGVALGIELSSVSTGPFYQFQNSDDDEESLAKLVLQLCRRIPNLEPDEGVVKAQVQTFKNTVAKVSEAIINPQKGEKKVALDAGSLAKVLEEMKIIVRELQLQMEHRISGDPYRYRNRKLQRFHRMMIDDLASGLVAGPGDPIGLLIMVSFLRDDLPWLYELGLEVYRAIKADNPMEIEHSVMVFSRALEIAIHEPFFENKEAHMMLRELSMFMDRYLRRFEAPSTIKAVRGRAKDSKPSKECDE